jgi:hypothetical protein
MKIQQANKYQVPILTEHFIIDSLRLKQLQPASAYSLSSMPIVDKPIKIEQKLAKPAKTTDTPPFQVTIRSVDSSTPFQIKEEVTELGRGPFLEIQEKKMSRKQGFLFRSTFPHKFQLNCGLIPRIIAFI